MKIQLKNLCIVIKVIILFIIVIIAFYFTFTLFQLYLPSLIATLLWVISHFILIKCIKKTKNEDDSIKTFRKVKYGWLYLIQLSTISGVIFSAIILIAILILYNVQILEVLCNCLLYFYIIIFGVATYLIGTGLYYSIYKTEIQFKKEYNVAIIKFVISIIICLIFYISSIWIFFSHKRISINILENDPIGLFSFLFVIYATILITINLLEMKDKKFIYRIFGSALAWAIGEFIIIYMIFTLQINSFFKKGFLYLIIFLFFGLLSSCIFNFGFNSILNKIVKERNYKWNDFEKEIWKHPIILIGCISHGIISLVLGYFFHFWGYILIGLIPANFIVALWVAIVEPLRNSEDIIPEV